MIHFRLLGQLYGLAGSPKIQLTTKGSLDVPFPGKREEWLEEDAT
jgi:hypothetical protein